MASTSVSGVQVTLGIDLSSRDRSTAACLIEWRDGRAAIRELRLGHGVSDGDLVSLIGRADKVGIDIPLGWPQPFVEAVKDHAAMSGWPATYSHDDNDDYRLRATDRWVRDCPDLPTPLSVAADRIAIPAMRAAALLAHVDPAMPRDGSGRVIEVYPAAALCRWNLWHARNGETAPRSPTYKGPDGRRERERMVDSLARRTAKWLTFDHTLRCTCIESDDAFDSIIAAFVARAATVRMAGARLIDPIPVGSGEAARREGWIAVPAAGSRLWELSSGVLA